MKRIVVDVGNSRVSIALVIDGRLTDVEHFPTTDTDRSADRLIQAAKRHRATVAIASVVPEASKAIVEKITPCVETVLQLATTSQTAIQGVYAGMGIDRIANLAAALKLFGDGGGAFVLDFGTATTFSAVDEKGRFRGGWITLGLKSTLRALNEYTGQLPDLSQSFSGAHALALGGNTEEAITHGTLIAQQGMVTHWVATARKLLPGRKVVVATGGNARLIAPLSELIDVVEPNLTLLGIDLIAEEAVLKDPA